MGLRPRDLDPTGGQRINKPDGSLLPFQGHMQPVPIDRHARDPLHGLRHVSRSPGMGGQYLDHDNRQAPPDLMGSSITSIFPWFMSPILVHRSASSR